MCLCSCRQECFTDFLLTKRILHLQNDRFVIFADMMYIVQQFHDGEFRQSEALAEFSIIIFL